MSKNNSKNVYKRCLYNLGDGAKVICIPGYVTKPDKLFNELLKNTVFYKVGHHSSHNGTASVSGLDLMNNNRLVAFIPLVQDKVPVAWGGAKNFPAAKLYPKLIEKAKGRVVLFHLHKHQTR